MKRNSSNSNCFSANHLTNDLAVTGPRKKDFMDNNNCTDLTFEEAYALGLTPDKFTTFAAGVYGPKRVDALRETMSKLWDDLRDEGEGLYVRRAAEFENDFDLLGFRMKSKISFRVAPKNGKPFTKGKKFIWPEGARLKYFKL